MPLNYLTQTGIAVFAGMLLYIFSPWQTGAGHTTAASSASTQPGQQTSVPVQENPAPSQVVQQAPEHSNADTANGSARRTKSTETVEQTIAPDTTLRKQTAPRRSGPPSKMYGRY